MPYINAHRRDYIYSGGAPTNAGELNFLITSEVLEYLGTDYNYQKINDAIGVLECAKMELYRRLAAPYEDTKIMENGDVYNG